MVFGLDEVLRIHDPDFVKFLKDCYTLWERQFGPNGFATAYTFWHEGNGPETQFFSAFDAKLLYF